jgi:peroxiredoxin
MAERIFLALSAVALIAACGGEQTSGPGGATVSGTGATASDFSARDIDGKTVKLSAFLGHETIVLSFWQTWCEPCIAEFPHMRRLYDANREKGFVIFGIAMDGPDTIANVPAFAKRNQLNFPILLDEDSHIAQLYNPKKTAPLSIVIDKTGKITAIREGYNPGDEEYLAQDVAKALDVASPPK